MAENDINDFPIGPDGSLSPEELEKLTKFVSRAVKDIMKSLSVDGSEPVNGPYGFNIRIDKQGVPIIERAAAPKPHASPMFANAQPPKPSMNDANPLVDISETQKIITVTMEMRGVSKDSIAISVSNRQAIVRSANHSGQTTQTVALPREVNPQSAKARYMNGVLEIKVAKSKSAPEGTANLSVE